MSSARGHQLASTADQILINRGPALGEQDRLTLAACLRHHLDRVVDVRANPRAMRVAFGDFLSEERCEDVASLRQLRTNLERIAAMSLHLRFRGFELHLPRMLEISFQDGVARGITPRGSDLVHIRVLEPFAPLDAAWHRASVAPSPLGPSEPTLLPCT